MVTSESKGIDEKFCADCGAVIKIKAEICPKCGVRQMPAPTSGGKTHGVLKGILLVVGVVFLLVVVAIIKKGSTEAAKPILPVSVLTRNALLGPGRVVRISNHSAGATLDVVATFTNPTTQEQKKYSVTVSPGRFSEIGYAQGWIVHTGDQVSLYSAGYQTMSYNLQ